MVRVADGFSASLDSPEMLFHCAVNRMFLDRFALLWDGFRRYQLSIERPEEKRPAESAGNRGQWGHPAGEERREEQEQANLESKRFHVVLSISPWQCRQFTQETPAVTALTASIKTCGIGFTSPARVKNSGANPCLVKKFLRQLPIDATEHNH